VQDTNGMPEKKKRNEEKKKREEYYQRNGYASEEKTKIQTSKKEGKVSKNPDRTGSMKGVC
jgi:hypothetical protein